MAVESRQLAQEFGIATARPFLDLTKEIMRAYKDRLTNCLSDGCEVSVPINRRGMELGVLDNAREFPLNGDDSGQIIHNTNCRIAVVLEGAGLLPETVPASEDMGSEPVNLFLEQDELGALFFQIQSCRQNGQDFADEAVSSVGIKTRKQWNSQGVGQGLLFLLDNAILRIAQKHRVPARTVLSKIIDTSENLRTGEKTLWTSRRAAEMGYAEVSPGRWEKRIRI